MRIMQGRDIAVASHVVRTLAGHTPPRKPAFQHLLPHKPLPHTADRAGLLKNK